MNWPEHAVVLLSQVVKEEDKGVEEVVSGLAHLPHLLPREELVVRRVDRRLEYCVLFLLRVRFDGRLDEVVSRERPALRNVVY